MTAENCEEVSGLDCSIVSLDAYGFPIKGMMHYSQMAAAGQLQEVIPLEKWAAGELYSTPWELSKIDRVPVSLVIPTGDELCEPSL